MSCRTFEEWMALEIGGDLGPNETAVLQAHLSQCKACSRFAEELQASQASFRALHGAALEEDRLAAVRTTVLDEVRKTAVPPALGWEALSSPTWLRPRLALAGLAAALMAVSFWSFNRPGPAEEEPAIAAIPPLESPAPDVQANPEQPVPEDRPIETAVVPHKADVNPPRLQQVERKAAPRVQPSLIEERPAQPAANSEIEVVSMPDPKADDPDANPDVVLRLASNNPDITIYWLVGQNGD